MNKKSDQSGRKHVRSKVRSRLKMAHNELGELNVYCSDMSDGGVFIQLTAEDMPMVGDIVTVQIQDLPIEAPVIPTRVVRIDENGLGLEFVDQTKLEK